MTGHTITTTIVGFVHVGTRTGYLPLLQLTVVCAAPKAARERMTARVGNCILSEVWWWKAEKLVLM
jgi:hypothetical protein